MKRRTQILTVFALFALLAVVLTALGITPEERRTYLDKLVQTLPAVPSFNAWLERTRELPPDFDALPKINGLPDPLRFVNGRTVKTAEDWKARRAEIFALEEKYDVGTFPPKPRLTNVAVLSENNANGQITRSLRLEFGPDQKATLRAVITIPAGEGPFPVMISPNINVTAGGG